MKTGHPDATAPVGDTLVSPTRVRLVVFTAVCVVAIVVSTVAIVRARNARSTENDSAEHAEISAVGVAASLTDGVADLMFESTALGESYGRLASVPINGPDAERSVSDLHCERVDYQAGRGVCLRADRGFRTTYDALVFDAGLDVTHTVGLAGPPSRVRISPTGRLAGMTVFVSGHSYAQTGFSTQTTLVDLGTGEILADLETDFTVYRDGERWREVDFNFWGVTFVDDDRFYATLGTGGQHLLVEGLVTERRFDVVTDGVECPSLSPDGTRLAHKVRHDDGLGPMTWTIAVLDLATFERTELAEDRSVDDQVAWLDNLTVMYGLPDAESPAETDTWTVPANGRGAPELLIEGAWSVVPVEAG